MAYIYKPKKKQTIDSAKQKKRREIYNSKIWKEMRMAYLQNHPLSEISLWEGKTALTEHIHHITSFLDVPDELLKNYAYDSNNFIAVTSEEHNRLHLGDLRGCKTKEQTKEKVLNNLYRKIDNHNGI